MKVIEEKQWTLEIICTGRGNGAGGCGSKLELEQEDLHHTTSWSRGERDDYITIICIVCKILTDVTDIPDGIKR